MFVSDCKYFMNGLVVFVSSFSERLRLMQTERKTLKKNVAAAVGITYRHYIRYENGDAEPTLGVLVALANFYCVSLDWLAGLSDTRGRQP